MKKIRLIGLLILLIVLIRVSFKWLNIDFQEIITYTLSIIVASIALFDSIKNKYFNFNSDNLLLWIMPILIIITSLESIFWGEENFTVVMFGFILYYVTLVKKNNKA